MKGSTYTALPGCDAGGGRYPPGWSRAPLARGLHSSVSQLNLSASYGIGGARRGCVARVQGVFGGAYGVLGTFFVSESAQVELKSGRM